MLMIEAVKSIKIASTRSSRCYGEPTVFAMIVDDQTGYATEIEFASEDEANGFVNKINELTKKRNG